MKFYMQKVGSNRISLEDNFQGLYYKECKGLNAKGAIKNKYTESFADSDELRVFEPDRVLRSATTITFTFVFVGNNRYDTYNAFIDYISSGKIYYFDTARKKKAFLILLDAIEPTDDILKGGTPYLQAEFKFQNLWGECKKATDEDLQEDELE